MESWNSEEYSWELSIFSNFSRAYKELNSGQENPKKLELFFHICTTLLQYLLKQTIK